MTNEITRKLDMILADLERILGHPLEGVSFDCKTDLDSIFTDEESRAWLKNEADFTKRIATPLHGKRPPDKLPVYLEGGYPLFGNEPTASSAGNVKSQSPVRTRGGVSKILIVQTDSPDSKPPPGESCHMG